ILGRYDASYGLMLKGDGVGNFAPVDMPQSGFAIDGEVRDLKLLRGPRGQRSIAVARNNDRLLLLHVSSPTAGGHGATQTAPGERGARGVPLPPPPSGPVAQSTNSRRPRTP